MAAGPVARSRAQIPLRLCFSRDIPSAFVLIEGYFHIFSEPIFPRPSKLSKKKRNLMLFLTVLKLSENFPPARFY